MKHAWVGVLAAGLLAACSAQDTSEQPGKDTQMTENDPRQPVEAHMSAFASNDINQIVADYADDVIFVLPNEVRQGKSAVAEFFAPQMASPNAPEIGYKIISADGRVVITDWTLGGNTPMELRGRDVFVVEDGKIAMQTVYMNPPAP